jgi:hypothetical protein
MPEHAPKPPADSPLDWLLGAALLGGIAALGFAAGWLACAPLGA